MLSAEIHKDPTRYIAGIVGGLSARALLYSALALACGLAVGGSLTRVPWLPNEKVSTLIYASTIPP